MTPILKETLNQLESLGSEKVRVQNLKHGATENQFGVKLGDIRKVATKIKQNDSLAKELWDTRNLEARLLCILLLKPEKLSSEEVEQMLRSVDCVQVADWLSSYIIKKHPQKEAMRLKWMEDKDPWVLRAGWSLTWERTTKNHDGLDLDALLDRIENEMGQADPLVQWTMNFSLGGIGIHSKKHRERAIAIGEKLGLYRDYPVSKGCTSPFVPIWVREMVSREKSLG
ncbi:MAG: DNA alkylation repair protein [Candidatus Cloacimonetes bacterium]|nr:DNA alkylation repair protein [Candidatus Cloacimonadota bacterium]